MTNETDRKAKEIEQGLEALKGKPSAGKEDLSQTAKDKNEGMKAFSEIVGGLIFGVVFGYFIDDYFHTAPLFLIVFVILGLAGSVYSIYKASENQK